MMSPSAHEGPNTTSGYDDVTASMPQTDAPPSRGAAHGVDPLLGVTGSAPLFRRGPASAGHTEPAHSAEASREVEDDDSPPDWGPAREADAASPQPSAARVAGEQAVAAATAPENEPERPFGVESGTEPAADPDEAPVTADVAAEPAATEAGEDPTPAEEPQPDIYSSLRRRLDEAEGTGAVLRHTPAAAPDPVMAEPRTEPAPAEEPTQQDAPEDHIPEADATDPPLATQPQPRPPTEPGAPDEWQPRRRDPEPVTDMPPAPSEQPRLEVEAPLSYNEAKERYTEQALLRSPGYLEARLKSLIGDHTPDNPLVQPGPNASPEERAAFTATMQRVTRCVSGLQEQATSGLPGVAERAGAIGQEVWRTVGRGVVQYLVSQQHNIDQGHVPPEVANMINQLPPGNSPAVARLKDHLNDAALRFAGEPPLTTVTTGTAGTGTPITAKQVRKADNMDTNVTGFTTDALLYDLVDMDLEGAAPVQRELLAAIRHQKLRTMHRHARDIHGPSVNDVPPQLSNLYMTVLKQGAQLDKVDHKLASAQAAAARAARLASRPSTRAGEAVQRGAEAAMPPAVGISTDPDGIKFITQPRQNPDGTMGEVDHPIHELSWLTRKRLGIPNDQVEASRYAARMKAAAQAAAEGDSGGNAA